MNIKNYLLNFKHNKSYYLLGIDIRSNFIRLVELSYCNYKYRVENCVNLPLSDEEIDEKIIIATIKKILKSISAHTKSVAIALPHNIVIFKELQLSADLTSKDIEKFLSFSFAEQIKVPKKTINFAYQVVDKEVDGLVKLQAVAVRKNYIEKLVKLLWAAGLDPKIIDVDVYAMERSIRWQLKNIDDLVVIINIDYGQVLLVVLDNKKIVYKDEELLVNKDLSSLEQLIELFDTKLRLINSVLSTPIGCLVLGGEKVGLLGLDAAISQKFNIKVILANPFLDMEFSSNFSCEYISQIAPLMLISCGLTLRAQEDNEN